MATSGSKDFELDVADYVEEAFERCGLELRTGYDLKTAQRSLNLMLAEWANRGLNQWTVKEKTVAMVAGTSNYTIDSANPTATIDVLDVYIRQTSQGTTTDIPLSRMSRAEYAHLATKSTHPYNFHNHQFHAQHPLINFSFFYVVENQNVLSLDLR